MTRTKILIAENLSIIIGTALFMFFICFVLFKNNEAVCLNYWRDTSLNYRFTLPKGCEIEVESGKWIDAYKADRDDFGNVYLLDQRGSLQ